MRFTPLVRSENFLISVKSLKKFENLKILGKRRWLPDRWGVGLCNNTDINVSLLTFEVNSARKAKVKSFRIQLSDPFESLVAGIT